MKQRPPMDSVRVCPKCAAGNQNDVITAQRRPCQYRATGVTASGSIFDEYLERTCTRCNYQWEEACA